VAAKTLILRLARALGLFAIARRLTARSLRVLCFHAFAVADEGAFWPGVFIDPALFRRRMELLRRHGYHVAPLDAAVERLAAGGADTPTVAITFDDGFASVASHGAPILAEYGFPATLYVTSYHCATQTPVFRVTLQYLCWKSARETIEVGDLLDGIPTTLATADRDAIRDLYLAAETQLDEAGRNHLLATLAERLEVALETLLADRRFHNLDATTLRDLHAQGIDIQLHTHRHRLPLAPEQAAEEIEGNRAWLAGALGAQHSNGPLVHFCYPSGAWDEGHFPTLMAHGIRSATTLEPGLNRPRSEPLALRRITDNGRMDDVVFEAELSGLMDGVRALRRRAGRFKGALQRLRHQLAATWRHRRAAHPATRFADVQQVLFVCQGNICRSAYAEHALRRRVGNAVRVESCGLDVRESRPSPGRAVQAAHALGIDLSAHRSRAVDAEMIARADLVLAMEVRQLEALRAAYPTCAARFALLRDLAPLPHGLFAEIDDPYGRDLTAFTRCFRLIEQSLATLQPRTGEAHAC
jgi:protein-tyrosine-phosphatase/peptidoglycan/xylan/chitin deacetylase (PgdA/CDA1 family)